MQPTKKLKVENKWLRIDGREALSYDLPPRKWYVDTSRNIIKPISSKLYDRVPINWDLVENLRKEEVRNPMLLGADGWVYVGSQRLRALQYLYDSEGIDKSILVCRFVKNPLKIWNLWGGDEGKRCAAIQVQLTEIIFKSIFYSSETTIDGKYMHDFEVEGDKMYWKVRDGDPFWKEEHRRRNT